MCIIKTMHNTLCVTGGYLGELINKFLVVQVSGHIKNYNVIFFDTIDVINVKHCKMALLIKLYLFILLVTLTTFQGLKQI